MVVYDGVKIVGMGQLVGGGLEVQQYFVWVVLYWYMVGYLCCFGVCYGDVQVVGSLQFEYVWCCYVSVFVLCEVVQMWILVLWLFGD